MSEPLEVNTLKFSERIGLTQPKGVQLNGMDLELKNSLWNVLKIIVLDPLHNNFDNIVRSELPSVTFAKIIWINHLKKTVDTAPTYASVERELREIYFKCEWFKIYDLVG